MQILIFMKHFRLPLLASSFNSKSEVQLHLQVILDPVHTLPRHMSSFDQGPETLCDSPFFGTANIYGAALTAKPWEGVVPQTHLVGTRKRWDLLDG